MSIQATLSGGGACGELIRSIDWARTPLGPIDRWPQSLQTIVGVMLHSRHPMFLFWGPELVQIYNDGYLPSFGAGKHPTAMGQRGADCWQEIWPIIWPQIDDVMSRGIASWNEDQLVPILRNDRIEEVYWTYGYSPVYDESGAISGTLVVCTETTPRVLAERRLRVLRLLGDATASLFERDALSATAASIFATSPNDLPFALFYRGQGDALALAASTRIAADSVARVDAAVRRALAGATPPVHDVTLPLPDEISALLPASFTGARPRQVFVTKLARTADGTPRDDLVVFGLSANLPLDERYREHLHQLTDQLSATRTRIEALRARAAVESERTDLLLQAPAATALLLGPEHVYELANEHYVKMVGRDVVGKRYLDAFPEVRGTPLADIIERVYATGTPFSTSEMRVPLDHRGDGGLEDRYFQFSLQPIRDVADRVYGMMALAIDITDSVSARRALEEAAHERERLLLELGSANRAKDEFLAMLGHELRNPLSPIVTALQLMRLRRDGRSTKEEEMIARQVDHLVRLVDDLLDVSKITRGKIELKKETVEVNDVVAKAVEIAGVLFEKRRHELTVAVPRRGLCWHGDPVRLAQVVANLLTNAARYTEAGGRIALAADRDGHELVLRVKDNGIGITAEALPGIFDMFVQVNRSVDRSEGGLGLGLTLVKSLVMLHGGTVTARSEGIGRGSEFIVRVPGITTEPPTPTPNPRANVAQPHTPPRSILLVDDNTEAADPLAELLRLSGHTVAVAYDPHTAIAFVGHTTPDIAILDIGLPVMDGYELAAVLRRHAPACRMVALTGYGRDHDVVRSRAAGFEEHFVKPIEVDALLKFIDR